MPSKIRKRGKNSYTLTVATGYDEHGKQLYRRKTVKASSDREAEKQYTLFAAEVQTGQVYSGKCKLTEFARRWYKSHCLKELAPKTQESYKNHLEKRILPALGHLDINKIRPLDIKRFVDDLCEQRKRYDGRTGEASNGTARYCFSVLSSMLQDAMEWQVIPNNPCRRVKAPTDKKEQQLILAEKDVAVMLDALANEPLKYQTIILMAFDSGLRLGELMALKWSDVNMETGKIHVTKSNQALPRRGTFTKEPKTKSSVRSLTLSKSTIALLKQHQQQQAEEKTLLGDKWKENGWIFTQWNGVAMYPMTPSQWFRKFLKRHGIPHMTFHGLRRLSATMLAAAGIPAINVKNRLGHADIRTTMNIYASALQSVDQKAADSMDAILQARGHTTSNASNGADNGVN